MMSQTRRGFIKSSLLGGVGAMAFPHLLPSHIWAAEAKPNSRLTIGFIGMGTQSRGLLRAFLGEATRVTGAFFRPKQVEELFDYESEPDNVKNLVADPPQAERLARMREGLKKQQTMLHDCGFLPEGTLVHRAKENHTTIYELIRNPKLYDQPGYMKAADLANFAKPADLPKLVELLNSSDEGYRYWGVMGCIQLGKPAATPEVLKIMEKLIQTDANDERTLDVRVTAALYLCQINQKKDEALGSFAEVITTAEGKSPAKGRAWANLFLLGSDAKGIVDLLKSAKLKEKDQQTFSLFQSRLTP